MRHLLLPPPQARPSFYGASLVFLGLTALFWPHEKASALSIAGNMSVSATVLSSSNCRFVVPKSTTLTFGTIDPSSAINATASGSLVVRCGGSAANATFAITHDSGLHETSAGLYRMQHSVTPTAYLAYDVSYSPQSATIPKNTNQTITITGTVTPSQFGNAIAGNYTDTVTVSVSP